MTCPGRKKTPSRPQKWLKILKIESILARILEVCLPDSLMHALHSEQSCKLRSKNDKDLGQICPKVSVKGLLLGLWILIQNQKNPQKSFIY